MVLLVTNVKQKQTMIEIVFLIVQFATLVASFPQVVRLIKMKQSDELSIITWSIWLISQSVSLLYVVSINNAPLIIVNVSWVIYYLSMLVLILKYRANNKKNMAKKPRRLN